MDRALMRRLAGAGADPAAWLAGMAKDTFQRAIR
jgi:hypothetical protein